MLRHSSHDGAGYVGLIVIMEATKSAQEGPEIDQGRVRLINHNKEHFRICQIRRLHLVTPTH